MHTTNWRAASTEGRAGAMIGMKRRQAPDAGLSRPKVMSNRRRCAPHETNWIATSLRSSQ
jgi:hypothetical protein